MSRSSLNDIERMMEIAANFVRRNLDLIVIAGPEPLRAAGGRN
jgi:hypothetical protein